MPFYMQRSMENYPGGTALKSLTTGLDAIVRTLPPGSPAKLYCVKHVCERTLQLVAKGSAHEEGLGLVHLLAYVLLILDIDVSKHAFL